MACHLSNGPLTDHGGSFLQPWWALLSFLCNDILRCGIFGWALSFLCRLIWHFRVLSPPLVTHLICSSMLLSVIICSRSSLVIWLLTVSWADSRPPFTHQTFLYTQMYGLEERCNSWTWSTHIITCTPPSSPEAASVSGRWENGRCRDDTVHECHLIHQSVTGCRPSSLRDAVDL